ncbi:MAG: M15 family metallopeptidase [Alphaproteobacteria bacterium]
MPYFSAVSRSRLATCHPDLQKIFNKVIQKYDCTIIEGYRSQERQQELYRKRKSKVRVSKHNADPSLAVDVAPYPLPEKWGEGNIKELARFYHFVGYVKAVADEFGIPLRCGADWDGDNHFRDQKFDDLVHFELMKGA